MRRMAGLQTVPILATLVAVLLLAGAFSVAMGDARSQPTAAEGARVGAAGLSREALLDDQPAHSSAAPAPAVVVTSTVAAPPTATVPARPSPTLPPPTTTTAVRLATTVSPGLTLPPGVVLPPFPTLPPTPPASRWTKSAGGITIRMHIEPATPVAGQPVRFVIDEVTAPATCCTIHFQPGGGTAALVAGGNGPHPELGNCASAPVTRSGLSHTHTFAEAGVHPFLVMVLTTQCQLPAVDAGAAVPPQGVLDLLGCVTVGPQSAIRPETVPARCGG